MQWTTGLVVLIVLAAGLTGCIGADDATNDQVEPTATPHEARSIVNYELPETITGLEQVTHVDAEGGQGLYLDDGYAYVSAGGAGFYVVDIRDPQEPVLLAEVPDAPSRDVDLLFYGDRKVAALAQGNANMHFVDVTDPARPELLATLDVGTAVHNLAVVPGTHLVYNSRSLGDVIEPGIDIVDASDPANPEVAAVWVFPRLAVPSPVVTTGCHDITVYPDVDRAYCAGVTQTYILDIADPMQPSVVSTITNPLINIHHWAMPNQDHSILIIGDEYGGAAAPACFASVTTDTATASTPTGAVWFYDISDPATPLLLSHVSPPMPENAGPAPCTAHFGELIEDRPLVAIGWYNAGVLLIDFEEPRLPRIVTQWETGENVWDARYWNGHLFTGDIGSGMDVLRLA